MKKISNQMILAMLLVNIISITWIWIYQVNFLEKNYIKEKIKKITEVVQKSENLIGKKDFKNFKELSEKMSNNQNINIDYFDDNINLIYSTRSTTGMQSMHHGMKMQDSFFEIAYKSISQGELLTKIKISRWNSNVLIYSKPIFKNKGVIIASIALETVSETTNLLKKQLVMVFIILIIISILMGSFFSRLFIFPIKILNKSLKKIADGNLDIKVDLKSKNEFKDVEENINKMVVNLSQVDDLRKDFIANVSHELKTPLGLIIGYAEYVRDVCGDDLKKRNENMDIIIKESERLNEIVKDILQLSLIQSKSIVLKKEEFNLVEMIQSVLDFYNLHAKNNNIDLIFETDEMEIFIYADAQKIEQVLHNLISNALNHTKEFTEVIVKIKKFKDKIRVEINDEGEGIAQEDIDKIWDRFYKGAETRNYLVKSTGLGLAIVKNILQLHDFFYGVESRKLNGSCFYFEIFIKPS